VLPVKVTRSRSAAEIRRHAESIGVVDVEAFVERFSGAELVRSRSVEVFILGAEGGGKTSLVRALATGSPARSRSSSGEVAGSGSDSGSSFDGGDARGAGGGAESDRSSPLFGVSQTAWKTEMGVNFSIWDFQGSPEHVPTHRLFLHADALYILVFDAGRKLEDTQTYVETWASVIASRVVGAHLMLVGTRADSPFLCGAKGHARRSELLSTLEAYAERASGQDAIRVQAGMLVNLHPDEWSRNDCRQLQRACETAGMAIVSKREWIPKDIVRLRNVIKQHARDAPVQTCAEFSEFVLHQLQLPTKRALPLSTINLMIRWGWILAKPHCHEPALADTVFLDPFWLAQMMANLARAFSGEARPPNGVVSRESLEAVWRDQDKHIVDVLILLLKDTELIFDFRDGDDENDRATQVLIPSLLPPKTTAETNAALARLDSSGRLTLLGSHFTYTLSRYPAGLLNQLFARVAVDYELDSSSFVGWQSGFAARVPAGLFQVELKRGQALVLTSTSSSARFQFEKSLLEFVRDAYVGITIFRNGAGIEWSSDQATVIQQRSEVMEFDSQLDVIEERILGAGSFGIVAVVAGTGRNPVLLDGSTYAMKYLHPQPARLASESSLEFEREFKLMRKMTPCQYCVSAIAAQYDRHISPPRLTHVLMPLYEKSLAAVLAQRLEDLDQIGWFDASETETWLEQLAQGADFLHHLGYAHLEYVNPPPLDGHLSFTPAIIILLFFVFGLTSAGVLCCAASKPKTFWCD
jgi:C-terminal of Roc, COR, domain/Ras of Complex, Roc, domain of DAPkinase